MCPVPNRQQGRELTRDTFYRGRVIIHQPRQGWRFSVDAPILADFIGPQPRTIRAVEIGGGCGVISLLLLTKNHLQQVSVYEIQPFYARLCACNARVNGLQGRLDVVCADYLSPCSRHEPADLIFSNPPFFAPMAGRISPNREIALAKWEIGLKIETLLSVIHDRLSPSGRLIMILPAEREEEFRALISRFSLFIERYRAVKPFPDGKTERFLIQLTAESAVERRQAPLVLFSRPGVHSAEMTAILQGQ